MVNKIKKLSLALVLTTLFLTGTAGLFADDDCPSACSKFFQCTEEMKGRKATAKEKDTLTKGCENACKKKKKEVLGCYTESNKSGGSCQTYATCVYRFASAMKK